MAPSLLRFNYLVKRVSTSSSSSSREQAKGSHPIDVLLALCSRTEVEWLRGRESGKKETIDSRLAEETLNTNYLANEELNGFPDVNIVLGRCVEPACELVLATESIHLSGIQFICSSGIALFRRKQK